MGDKITSLTARRATLEEFDLQLLTKLESSLEYIGMGIDIAAATRDFDPEDSSDGLVMMEQVLCQTIARLKKLSPYLGD